MAAIHLLRSGKGYGVVLPCVSGLSTMSEKYAMIPSIWVSQNSSKLLVLEDGLRCPLLVSARRASVLNAR